MLYPRTVDNIEEVDSHLWKDQGNLTEEDIIMTSKAKVDSTNLIKHRQDERQDAALDETSDVLKYVQYLSKSLVILFAAWTFGYYGLSFAWILFGGLLYIVWYARKKQKLKRSIILKSVTQNEKDTVLATLDDLPSWVFFPDAEKAEWVNKIIYQVWPFVSGIVEKTLRQTIEPEINRNMPHTLKGIKFDVISLGDLPPRIGGVKAHTSHVSVKRTEVILDVDIIYAGNAKLTVIAKGVTVGVQDLLIRGTLRVILYPLVSQVPLVGGITCYFINRPKVDFDLTNALNVFDMPGINVLLRSIVSDTIAKFIVLPNKVTVPLMDQVKSEHLKISFPDGVLRIKIVQGKELEAKDFNLVGKSNSDPYVNIMVGAEKFKTTVKKDTLNPVWNELFEIFIDEFQSREIELQVCDRNFPSKDEFLGKASIQLASVLEHGYKNLWVPLEKAKTGKLHLQLTWLKFSNEPEDIKIALPCPPTKNISIAKSALIVYIDSARNLSVTGSHCNPACRINVGNSKYETSHLWDTINPVWEQTFRFLIYSPEYEDIKIKVFDHKKDRTLGQFVFRIGTLLHTDEMCIAQAFPLQKSSQNATITLKVLLRGLVGGKGCRALERTISFNVIDEVDQIDRYNIEEEKVENKTEMTNIDRVLVKEDETHTNGNIRTEEETSDDLPFEKDDNKKGGLSRTSSTKSEGRFNLSSLKRKARLFSSQAVLSDDFNPITPQGELRLGIFYNEEKQRLVISVDQARDLLPETEHKNNNIFINPYVRIYLLPDKSRITRLTTDVVKHTSNPIFSETLWYSVESIESCRKRKLDIVVKTETPLLQKAKGVKYNICRAVIDLAKENLEDEIPVWFSLYKIEED